METKNPRGATANTRRAANASRSLAMRQYHASVTPEQRAAWRSKVSAGTKAGMDTWHAGRSEEHRELARQRITDAAVCAIWTPHRPGNRWQKGHKPVGNTTPEALARRESTRVSTASVKRILKDIAETQPELIRDAVMEGLRAPPPRSFPYVALAAAYLDGKPVDAQPEPDHPNELAELSIAQLAQRATALAERLYAEGGGTPKTADVHRKWAAARDVLPVINVEVIPEREQ